MNVVRPAACLLPQAMVQEMGAGRVRALGLSNFNETQIERIMKHSEVRPDNLQVEVHVFHQQKPLVDFCKKNGISVTAYSPLGCPGNAWIAQTSG